MYYYFLCFLVHILWFSTAIKILSLCETKHQNLGRWNYIHGKFMLQKQFLGFTETCLCPIHVNFAQHPSQIETMSDLFWREAIFSWNNRTKYHQAQLRISSWTLKIDFFSKRFFSFCAAIKKHFKSLLPNTIFSNCL